MYIAETLSGLLDTLHKLEEIIKFKSLSCLTKYCNFRELYSLLTIMKAKSYFLLCVTDIFKINYNAFFCNINNCYNFVVVFWLKARANILIASYCKLLLHQRDSVSPHKSFILLTCKVPFEITVDIKAQPFFYVTIL